METFDPITADHKCYLGLDFCNELAEGDSIASATVTATDPASSPTDVTSTFLDATKQNIDGTVVNVWVRDGVSGHTYTFKCIGVTTVSGETIPFSAQVTVE